MRKQIMIFKLKWILLIKKQEKPTTGFVYYTILIILKKRFNSLKLVLEEIVNYSYIEFTSKGHLGFS